MSEASNFEQFAEKYLGVKLSDAQKKFAEALVEGDNVTILWAGRSRPYGKTSVLKAYMEYHNAKK